MDHFLDGVLEQYFAFEILTILDILGYGIFKDQKQIVWSIEFLNIKTIIHWSVKF